MSWSEASNDIEYKYQIFVAWAGLTLECHNYVAFNVIVMKTGKYIES